MHFITWRLHLSIQHYNLWLRNGSLSFPVLSANTITSVIHSVSKLHPRFLSISSFLCLSFAFFFSHPFFLLFSLAVFLLLPPSFLCISFILPFYLSLILSLSFLGVFCLLLPSFLLPLSSCLILFLPSSPLSLASFLILFLFVSLFPSLSLLQFPSLSLPCFLPFLSFSSSLPIFLPSILLTLLPSFSSWFLPSVTSLYWSLFLPLFPSH